jgi:hypothetical protein
MNPLQSLLKKVKGAKQPLFWGLATGSLCIAAFGQTNAQAATLFLYTDRTAFLNAIESGIFIEDFESTPIGGTANPLSFSDSGFSFDVTASGFFNPLLPLFPFTYTGGTEPSSIIVATADSAQPLNFTFGPGVTAFGGDFYGTNTVGDALSPGVLELELVGFSSTFQWNSDTTDNNPQFIGVVSDGAAFTSIVLNPNPDGLYDPESPNEPFIFAGADNVILGKILPVDPVPGPLPILGVAAAFKYSRKIRQRIHGNKKRIDDKIIPG